MPLWSLSTVEHIHHWNERAFSLRLDAKLTDFLPGQFIQLGLPTKTGLLKKPYSLVSAPGEQIEVYITLNPDGALTPRLRQLQVGNPIGCSMAALGQFNLNKVAACAHLWLMAAGSGIAPFLSMLKAGISLDQAQYISLLHGIKTPEDIPYRDLIENLKKHYRGRFRYWPVFSQSRQWQSDLPPQRLPAYLASASLEPALSPLTSQVMICGSSEMVSQTQAVLNDQYQLKRHTRQQAGQVHVERY